jgi:hypothetical protein
MRIPLDSELIAIWERASGEHPVDRALMLLSACSGESLEELAVLSVGSRDARLLEIYECFFGSTLDAFAECPACAEALEYSLSTCDLASPVSEDEDDSLTIETGQASVRLRLPDSRDLRAISGCVDLAAATKLLMERCVIEVLLDKTQTPIEMLPEVVIDEIASTLAAANPQADTLIDLSCTSCSHQWQIIFDIEPFLWSKISAIVRRLLRQVHALASVYGWSELDILTLSPTRRQIYVEMAGS